MRFGILEYGQKGASVIDGQSVSLLISTRNRPLLMNEALQSVVGGSTLPDEIVVVDQSDIPHEVFAASVVPESVSLQYIWSPTTGTSRSRNIAFEHVSHQIAVVIDDDCLVTDDWLEVIVRSLLAAGPRAVVTGRVLGGEPEVPGAFAPSLHASDLPAEFCGRTASDPLATFNFAIRTVTYAEVGQFDTRMGPGTRFPSAEDNDYGYRLLLAGYTIVFEPAALVHHRAWRSDATYVALRYAYGRGQGAYYGKHLAARDAYMLVKLFHALLRRGKQMRGGGRHGVKGELAWIAGWAIGIADWLIWRPHLMDGSSSHPTDLSSGDRVSSLRRG